MLKTRMHALHRSAEHYTPWREVNHVVYIYSSTYTYWCSPIGFTLYRQNAATLLCHCSIIFVCLIRDLFAK